MSRVEIPAPGDLIMDAAGNVQSSVAVSLTLAGTATAVTHYSALTGGTSTTGGLVTSTAGTIVNGSGNVRYIDSGNPVDMTVAGATRRIQPVSAGISTTIVAFDEGVVGDGSTDDQAALNALALAYRGRKIIVPPVNRAGNRTTLRFTQRWVIQSGTEVDLTGVKLAPDGVTDHAIFLADTDSGGSVTTPSFSAVGATSIALTATATRKAQTVTVATGLTIAAGQACAIWDDSLLGGVAYRRERNIVESYNSGTGVVTLKDPLNFNYGSASVEPEVTLSGTATSGMGTNPRLLTFTPVSRVEIKGGEFDMNLVVNSGGAGDRCAISGYWVDDCTVKGYQVYNHEYKACDFSHAYRTEIRQGRTKKPKNGGPGLGYGPARLAYSRHCVADTMWAESPGNSVVDIAGGSDISVAHVSCGARRDPADFPVGVFCHGLFEQRITGDDIRALNLIEGVTCGNSSFGPTVDSSFTNVVTYGCDRGARVTDGCRGISIQGRFFSSVERAVAIQDSTDVEIDAYVGGNQSASLAAITVSGACADIRIRRPTLRGTLAFSGITVTQTAGAGKVKIIDPDIDMGSTAQSAIAASGLVAGGSVIVKGGEIATNDATIDAVSFAGPADYVQCKNVEFAGAMLRCLRVSGLPLKVRVRGNYFASSTNGAVAIRIEDVGGASAPDVLAVTGNDFNMTGTTPQAIALTTAVTSLQGNVIDIHGNRFGTITTRFANTGAATVRGVLDVLTASAGWNPASLVVGASERKSVTVSGAVVGDPATAGLDVIAATGWDIQAAVIAANTVEVKITNNTAGTVDLASGIVRVDVWKHS
jgi:hypothetical protein